MSKMSKLEKKLAVIILMIVSTGLAVLLVSVFIGKPNNAEIESLNKEIVSLADKVEEAKKAPALIVSYKEKINMLIGGSEESSNLLNKKIDVPDILQIIESSAASSGVQFEEISMNGNASFVKGGLIEKEDGTKEEIVNTENFYLLEIKMKTVSDYVQLWNFLKGCEDSGFYVAVDHIAVADTQTAGARLAGEVQINIYSLIANEATESKAG
jgi:hypothetical protein